MGSPSPSGLQTLEAAVDALRALAGQLRTDIARARAATESAHWASAAASQFRQEAEQVCADLAAAADGLELAAALLAAHAVAVSAHPFAGLCPQPWAPW